jgi:prophage regulatory protein
VCSEDSVNNINAAPHSFLRFPQVCKRVGLSRSTILRLQAAGLFPPCYRISRTAVAFLSSDIDDWMHARVTPKQAAIAYLRNGKFEQRGE